MNISTLAKILGVSINELRKTGSKQRIYGFHGRNTRIPYKSAVEITKILRPEKAEKLKNDDKIYVESSIKVADFAEAMGKQPGEVVKKLILSGVMVTLNEKIDYDTAELIADEFGIKIHPENKSDFQTDEGVELNNIVTFENNGSGKLIERPPVITVMGHVDHGKTTLLDTIRKANVAGGEAGAITQHISSYQVEKDGKKLTFVDTPGHEAFTAMRARGSQLADFVILVVSSTEGPKPQTVEVIERVKIAKTPVIVALNKVDLPESDVEKVKGDLSKYGLVPEEWGGEVPFIPISAKTGENIDKLLETIFLMAEVAELKAEVDCPGQAVIIESHKDVKFGVVATVLITKDTIKVGDYIQCGVDVAKIKKLENSSSEQINSATITEPVMLLGLNEIADVGEILKVYPSKKEASKAADEVASQKASKKVYYNSNIQAKDGNINLILKADVSGSLEALKEAILKIPQEQTKVEIVAESVGNVSESDLEYAQTTGSTLLVFHTGIDTNAANKLRNEEVNLIKSNIIYELLEWVEEELLKKIEHEIRYETLGKAKVLATFSSDKQNIQIFGGEVISGKIFDNKNLRIWRDDKEVGMAEIVELQRNKSKAKEVYISQQFGISVNSKFSIQKGDVAECVDEVLVS